MAQKNPSHPRWKGPATALLPASSRLPSLDPQPVMLSQALEQALDSPPERLLSGPWYGPCPQSRVLSMLAVLHLRARFPAAHLGTLCNQLFAGLHIVRVARVSMTCKSHCGLVNINLHTRVLFPRASTNPCKAAQSTSEALRGEGKAALCSLG